MKYYAEGMRVNLYLVSVSFSINISSILNNIDGLF